MQRHADRCSRGESLWERGHPISMLSMCVSHLGCSGCQAYHSKNCWMGRESLSGSGGQIAHLPQDASCIPFQVQNNLFSCCRESDNTDNKGLFIRLFTKTGFSPFFQTPVELHSHPAADSGQSCEFAVAPESRNGLALTFRGLPLPPSLQLESLQMMLSCLPGALEGHEDMTCE